MRIVAGTLRGRRLSAPRGTATRPTSDRVREALFSGLESAGVLHDARVLDAFAGTGALGLEALSRGAHSATLVENGRGAAAALRANVESLGVTGAVRLVRGDVCMLAARSGIPGSPFSLLFLDPPYKLDKFKVRGLIESLRDSGALTCDVTVVWEHATGSDPEWPSGFVLVKEKRYGDTTVSIANRSRAGEV